MQAKQNTYVSIYGVHHDPEYWPNPHRFDPDRFRQVQSDDCIHSLLRTACAVMHVNVVNAAYRARSPDASTLNILSCIVERNDIHSPAFFPWLSVGSSCVHVYSVWRWVEDVYWGSLCNAGDEDSSRTPVTQVHVHAGPIQTCEARLVYHARPTHRCPCLSQTSPRIGCDKFFVVE